jgi:hypothetical protein
MAELTRRQEELLNLYRANNYFKYVNYSSQLPSEVIMEIEKESRGQSANRFWHEIKAGRPSASGSYGAFVKQNVAMTYGLDMEENLKNDPFLKEELSSHVNNHMKKKYSKCVFNSGVILSKRGVFCASPDAYFSFESDNGDETVFVPVEIKNPHRYANQDFDDVVQKLGPRATCINGTAFRVTDKRNCRLDIKPGSAHWVQMQKQMYVMNCAPYALYVVQFGTPEGYGATSCTAMFACYRDDNFMKTENENELKFISLARLRIFDIRFDTFYNCCNIQQGKEMASLGLYRKDYSIKCIFCDFDYTNKMSFDIDKILKLHSKQKCKVKEDFI